MLYADVTTGEAGGLIGTAVALTAVVIKVGDWVKGWRKETRDNRRQDESDALSRMEDMLNRADRMLKESERENRKLREQAERATVRAERAIVWIKHLEGHLRAHNIPFEPWTEDGGSTTVRRPPGPVIPHRTVPDTDVADDSEGDE